jgi:uncharacterized protein (TIGR00645 family)
MADGERSPADRGTGNRNNRRVARAVLAVRWIMAPVYIGLLVALGLDVIKFVQKLALAAPSILTMDTNETMLTILSLIDLCLIGNLIVIVVFSSWENVLSPIMVGADGNALSNVNFSMVKRKLVGSIAAIAAIQILETFVHIDDVQKSNAMWQLAILLGIGLTGVLLALMDRLSAADH